MNSQPHDIDSFISPIASDEIPPAVVNTAADEVVDAQGKRRTVGKWATGMLPNSFRKRATSIGSVLSRSSSGKTSANVRDVSDILELGSTSPILLPSKKRIFSHHDIQNIVPQDIDAYLNSLEQLPNFESKSSLNGVQKVFPLIPSQSIAKFQASQPVDINEMIELAPPDVPLKNASIPTESDQSVLPLDIDLLLQTGENDHSYISEAHQSVSTSNLKNNDAEELDINQLIQMGCDSDSPLLKSEMQPKRNDKAVVDAVEKKSARDISDLVEEGDKLGRNYTVHAVTSGNEYMRFSNDVDQLLQVGEGILQNAALAKGH